MKLAKITALFLAALMCAAMIAACADGAGTDGTTASSVAPSPDASNSITDRPANVDEEGYLLDSLPELDFGDTDVWMLYDTKFSMPEYFVDSESGETVNDAIYQRNMKVEERLKVKLKFKGELGNDKNQEVFVGTAMNDVKSGDNLYSLYGAYSRTIPLLSMQGGLQNLLETEYFDVEKPWWPDALTNECTINGKLFFATGDISTNTLWMMCAISLLRVHSRGTGGKQHLDPRQVHRDSSGLLRRRRQRHRRHVGHLRHLRI